MIIDAGSLVMMGLGPFRFAVPGGTYQQLTREVRARWPAQERVGRRPALQFTGPGEETLELAGVIYPYYTGGLEQIRGMRAQAQAGAPLMMVSGLGDVYGLWVILGVRDTESFFRADGLARRVEFTLELSAYGPDGAGIGGGLF